MRWFLAAKRATNEDLNTMRGYLDLMRQTRDNDRKFAEADYRFHLTVVKAAHNPIMDMVMKVIEKMLARAIEKAADLHEWRPTALAMHGRIYQAIAKRQSRQAAVAVEQLIEETLNRYHKLMDKGH